MTAGKLDLDRLRRTPKPPQARGALELALHPTRTSWRSAVEFGSALGSRLGPDSNDLSGMSGWRALPNAQPCGGHHLSMH